MISAAITGDIASVEKLIQRGAEVNSKDVVSKEMDYYIIEFCRILLVIIRTYCSTKSAF